MPTRARRGLTETVVVKDTSFTWTRKTGLVMDQEARRAQVDSLMAAYPVADDETPLRMCMPSIGWDEMTSAGFRRAYRQWSSDLHTAAESLMGAVLAERGLKLSEPRRE